MNVKFPSTRAMKEAASPPLTPYRWIFERIGGAEPDERDVVADPFESTSRLADPSVQTDEANDE
jgi:hypothetical protein